MSWQGFSDKQATIEINLEKSEDELWNSLDKDAKWGVKKAEKSGLKVGIVNNEAIWGEFYKIYKETCKFGNIVPISIDDAKHGRLFGCFLENKMIAGSVVKIEGDKIILFLNASEHESLKYQPNNLLYWSIIKWAKNQGFGIFDLGGFQLNAKPGDKLYEINRFKQRWGGEIKEYKIYSKNPVYILGRKVIRNFPLVKKTRDNIKTWLNKDKFK